MNTFSFLFQANSILKYRAEYRPHVYEIEETSCNSMLKYSGLLSSLLESSGDKPKMYKGVECC